MASRIISSSSVQTELEPPHFTEDSNACEELVAARIQDANSKTEVPLPLPRPIPPPWPTLLIAQHLEVYTEICRRPRPNARGFLGDMIGSN